MAPLADHHDHHDVDDLARMLDCYQLFVAGIYGLIRLLEYQVPHYSESWRLIRPGYHAITRNGKGAGLESVFEKADWVTSHISIAFGETTKTRNVKSVTHTDIPDDGVDLLVFQVRWHEKSPKRPVVWGARLRIKREGDDRSTKWEDYQNDVLSRLESKSRPNEGEPGRIKVDGSYIVASRGDQISFAGTYMEVSLGELLSEQDVAEKLIRPALQIPSLVDSLETVSKA